MREFDLVLEGKALLPWGLCDVVIGVEDGKISFISKSGGLVRGLRRIVLGDGEILIPGIIDAHTHVRGMGRSDWEDFHSGSMAAAAGGVTCIFEMPITLPSTSTVIDLREKIKQASEQSIVNFGFHGGGGFEAIPEIHGMSKLGVVSFKIFMHPPPRGRESDFRGLYINDDSQLFECLYTINCEGKPAYIHAENHVLAEYFMHKQMELGGGDLIAYTLSKPSVVECEAISSVAIFASHINAKIHIAHLSSKDSIPIIKFFKNAGLHITSETAPHYLQFTLDEVKHLGSYAKVNPPIRSKEDRVELWKALSMGVIDIVASDHASYPKSVKDVDDIWKAYMGVPGIECLAPIVFNGVNRGFITLWRAVEALSTNVARIFGLYPRKGLIAIGSDADLTVVNLKERKVLKSSEFHTKARDIALLYDNVEVVGVPVMTIVNGVLVMDHGEIVGKPGTGRYVKV
ncbi:MAG: dihydroorotase family protein [Candidatus Methanomethylicia archaeon]